MVSSFSTVAAGLQGQQRGYGRGGGEPAPLCSLRSCAALSFSMSRRSHQPSSPSTHTLSLHPRPTSPMDSTV